MKGQSNMNKISVIIPIYNAEKCISRCISSIINQTYNNLEIIAVDDCSKDASLALLNKYAQNDERLVIVKHCVNKGAGEARLTGLRESSGTYIAFVDADDWLALNAFEILIDKIESENADMVTGAIVKVMDKYGLIKSVPSNNYSKNMLTSTIEQPQLFENYFISFFGVNSLFVTVWGKLYKKEILMKAAPDSNNFRMGEDLIFSMLIHIHLTKIAFVDNVIYYYRFGGITSQSNPTFLEDIKKQYRIKDNTIHQYNYLKALPYIKYELINCFYSYLKGLLVKDGVSEEHLKKFIIEELKDEIYTEATSNVDLDNRGVAIKEHNIDEIMNIVMINRKREKRIYRIKETLFKILN